MKRSRLAAVATAAVTMLALSGCGGDDALDTDSGTPAASDTIVVGSANFAESTLLAEIYAGALEAKGVKVDKKLNIGSREVYMKALEDGSIDGRKRRILLSRLTTWVLSRIWCCRRKRGRAPSRVCKRSGWL